eukprot:1320772-Amphidinium_carterae.1
MPPWPQTAGDVNSPLGPPLPRIHEQACMTSLVLTPSWIPYHPVLIIAQEHDFDIQRDWALDVTRRLNRAIVP